MGHTFSTATTISAGTFNGSGENWYQFSLDAPATVSINSNQEVYLLGNGTWQRSSAIAVDLAAGQYWIWARQRQQNAVDWGNGQVTLYHDKMNGSIDAGEFLRADLPTLPMPQNSFDWNNDGQVDSIASIAGNWVIDLGGSSINLGNHAGVPVPFKTAPSEAFTINLEIVGSLPIINVITGDPTAGEPSNPGQWTITRTGDLTQSLVVNYTVSGSAGNGSDYQGLPGVVTIAAGQSSATLDLVVIDDDLVEGNETVTLNLSPGAYTWGAIASTTIAIADDDYDPDIPGGDAGNTMPTAKDLGNVRSFIKTTSDQVSPTDKKDYFKVTMLTWGTLNAQLTGVQADIDIELLREDGYLIDFSDNSGVADEEINRTVHAGIYYLFIYPYGNVTSGYTLNVWKS